MTIIIFLIILAVLILVHELGHFIVAKKSGIRVDEFGLGFPPKIFAKKFGNTLYTLNAIPFGGFVKIFGEDSHSEAISEENKSVSFTHKPKWIQALVLVAGVTFNLIFAWLLISLGFMIGLPSSTDYSGFGKVSDSHLVITEVMTDSPAGKAGLLPGDEIVLVSSAGDILGSPNISAEDVQKFINQSVDKLEINYKRGNDPLRQASLKPLDNIVPGKKAIGVAMDNIGTLKLPIHLALIEGVKTTWSLTQYTVTGLGKFLWDIILFRSDFSGVTGPIGIAKIVGGARSLGFTYLLSLVSLISINLAVINLLPFPALDGGRLLFILIEVIIRRPIKPSFVKWTNAVGFTFLIILMIVVTGHDIFSLL